MKQNENPFRQTCGRTSSKRLVTMFVITVKNKDRLIVKSPDSKMRKTRARN